MPKTKEQYMKKLILVTLIFLTGCDSEPSSYYSKQRRLTNEEYLDIRRDIKDLQRPDWAEIETQRKINMIAKLLQYTDYPPTITIGDKKLTLKSQPSERVEVEEVKK